MANIEIRGLDAVQRKLSSLAELDRQLRPTMQRAVQFIHQDISEYVPKAPGAFSQLATPRQKRAYWAKVGAGQIRHGANGYIRSGNTGRAWTTKVTARPLTGIVGNNSPGARWVFGAQTQQPFHRASGFETDEMVVDDKADDIERMFNAAIGRIIHR